MIALGWLACAPLALDPCAEVDGLPVFPGAQGYGTDTPGGRGGATLVVTTTADHGPGSLREAIEAEGPRTVVFDVSGEIALAASIEVREPFLTVAGHTAPGEGVVLTGAGVVVFTHDVVLEHLRIRPGLGPVEPENNDALTVLPYDDGQRPHHLVFDHLSASWSEDELVALHDVRDVTISDGLFAEALDEGRHEKGGHSAGLLVGFGSSCVTVHHTLLAHNGFRNPLLTDVGRVDYLANVAYDFGELAGELLPDVLPAEVNLIGNTWVAGPWSRPGAAAFGVYLDHPVHASVEAFHLLTSAARARVYAEGNSGGLVANFDDPLPPELVAPTRFPGPPVDLDDAGVDRVYAAAGATRPARDAVDARVVDDAVNGTGGGIDDPAEVGGPDVPAASPPRPDADRDGVPDAWELEVGSDPHVDDARDDPDGDGYTRLEDWTHALR